MEYAVYVLYSYSTSKFYVGITSNIIQRIRAHNHPENKGFTRRYQPWQIIHVEFFRTKSEARKREIFLKTGHGRDWIKNHFSPGVGFISA